MWMDLLTVFWLWVNLQYTSKNKLIHSSYKCRYSSSRYCGTCSKTYTSNLMITWNALQLHHSIPYELNRTFGASQCTDAVPGLNALNPDYLFFVAQFDVFSLIGLRSAQMVIRPMLAVIPRLGNIVMWLINQLHQAEGMLWFGARKMAPTPPLTAGLFQGGWKMCSRTKNPQINHQTVCLRNE